MARTQFNNIDEYIASFPKSTQKVLQQIRKVIAAQAPQATEKISYAIPTFDLNGNLVHFAGYERHVGFYPGAAGVESFKDLLGDFVYAKGSIQFPLGQPLPVDLVKAIVQFRVQQNLAKKPKKKSAAKPPRKKTAATKKVATKKARSGA